MDTSYHSPDYHIVDSSYANIEFPKVPKGSSTSISEHRLEPLNGPRYVVHPSVRAPIYMLLCLLAGGAFALGHHLLYSSAHGKHVEDFWPSQAWLIRIGTGFAFASKLMFAVGVGVAFVQRQWYNLKNEPHTIRNLDTMTNVLENLLAFLDLSVWIRNPLLLVLAIVSWSIPIAAVVSPGTLSVSSKPFTNTTMMPISRPLLNGWMGSSALPGPDAMSQITYQTLNTDRLQKLLSGIAASGNIANLPSQFPNMTYSLDFIAPAVQCQSANDSVINAVSIINNRAPGPSMSYFYASWGGGTKMSTNSTRGPPSNYTTYYDGSVEINVMTNQGSWNKTVCLSSMPTAYCQARVANVTRCTLWNASYSVDFKFDFPRQTLKVANITYLHEVKFSSPEDQSIGSYMTIQNVSSATMARRTYRSMMDTFGEFLSGLGYINPASISVVQGNFQLLDLDYGKSEVVERTLQELFQNFTLSLFSNSTYIEPQAQARPVAVSIVSWPNTYTYDSRDLTLAYAIAFAVSVLCSLVGLHAWFLNERYSYSNIASTILRATSEMELHGTVLPEDTGSDPLPKHIAGVQISIGDNEKERYVFGRSVG